METNESEYLISLSVIKGLPVKNNEIVGHFGQLSTELQNTFEIENEVFLGEIYVNKLNLNELKLINYKPLSQYPFIKFDLSISVPVEFSAHLIVDEINKLLSKNENEKVFIFNGWTFSSDPNLTPFDHAIYDLQLLNCYNV